MASGKRTRRARGMPARNAFFTIASSLRSSPSEQSFGQEDQDEDEDDETEGVLVAEADVDRAERLGETEDEASEDGSRDVPHSAQDRDDEGLGRERAADLRVEVVDGVQQRSGSSDERGAEAEGDVGDLLGVDPHERGGSLVLSRGADHPSGVRLAEEKEERRAQE